MFFIICFLVLNSYYFEVLVFRLCCSSLDLSSAVSFTWDFWLSSSWSGWHECRPRGIVLCRSRCPNSRLRLGSIFLRSWPLEDLHYLPVTKQYGESIAVVIISIKVWFYNRISKNKSDSIWIWFRFEIGYSVWIKNLLGLKCDNYFGFQLNSKSYRDSDSNGQTQNP